MTRKDYIKFAEMLKDKRYSFANVQYKRGWNYAVSGIAESMADIFAADNPNFDRSRFLTACGVES